MDSVQDIAGEPGHYNQDTLKAMDQQTPGGVYLCQVGPQISCGACCGLYNVPHLSRPELTEMLSRRTLRFAATARTVAAIEAYALETARLEPQQRPFPELHHCPYIGLIGEAPGRVGCLLHPLADGNGGVDLRGLSYYGGMACRTYFCATTKELLPRWKSVLRQVLNHWYLFGIVVTEKDMLAAMLAQLESRLGRPLEPVMDANSPAADSLRALLGLKCRWPFRPLSHATACHYLFSDNAHPKPAVDYEALGTAPSVHDGILREMPSAFKTVNELRQAEALIDNHMSATVKAIQKE